MELLIRCLLIASFFTVTALSESPSLLQEGWKKNGFVTEFFEINGTESRNNPLRKQLKKPFAGNELYVRFRIRYDADSIDSPPKDEGEFVVLWLDSEEGNDRSTHSSGVPNVGIHVSKGANHFMVRYASGAEKFATELVGDKEFLIVARLWKSQQGEEQPFDQLNLWVNPKPEAELKPDATARSARAISTVNWIGFSTGGKTEVDDRIYLSDIQVTKTWRGILGLPEETLESKHSQPSKPIVRTIDFDQHVHPILKAKCFKCHAGEDAKHGIRLDIHDEVLNVSSPGSAASSQMFDLIVKREMPPEDEPQLTDQEIATLRTWIDEGIVWNGATLPTPIPKTDHWSFQPITRAEIPTVKNRKWVRTPVDAFVAKKQEALGIQPAPEADQATLARRMSLDLLGLPTEGNERQVNEMLDDPNYGERWGRHWLDVARWAESNGHQHNRPRPYAWRYRDWVVEAFNTSMPFDQFVRSQIAGDEMEPISPEDEGHLVATGFLAAARYSGNEMDKQIQRNDIHVDIVNTTGNAFLGLTFECAQCHTHKFDPLSIRDYYRFQAFFATGQPGNVSFASEKDRSEAVVRERWEIFDRTYNRQVAIRRRSGEPNPQLIIPKSVRARMSAADKERFSQLEKQIAEFKQVWAFYTPRQTRTVTPHEMRWPLEPASVDRKTHILLRGDVQSPGPEVEPGWPLVFGETPRTSEQPRLDLANWLTDRSNPLTARVWCNRIWYWHFGRGLVETVGDFGVQGTKPTHPELLDYLASELIEAEWDTRHIHRLILNSATYRLSSQFSERNAALDPQNYTWWRRLPRRLEAEAIRDSMLFVAGQLDQTRGGPSDADSTRSKRRSLYLKQERDRFPDQQELFDTANGITSCAKRRVSTNALQPLWLLNSSFSQRAAAALAKRAGSVEQAFQICLNRQPTAEERKVLEGHSKQHGLPSACLTILNSSEFLYLP